MRNQVKLAVCVLAVGLISTVLYAIEGTSGDNNWTGTTGDDLYNGLGGNDYVKGLAGNDTLNGDGGNDVIIGDDGADTLNGGSGNDTIISGAGGLAYARTATSLQSYGGNSSRMDPFDSRSTSYTMVEALASSGGDSWISSSSDENTGWGYTDRLKLKGFDFSAIPNDAVIVGIEIKIIKKRQVSWTSNYIYDHEIRVEKADATLGINQALSTSAETVVYGGPTSMMGLSLTVADVKNANFGFVIQMKVDGDYSGKVDHAKLTIYTANTHTDTSANNITGGTGNDLLYGSDQSDNYYYSNGHGLDTIYEVDAATSSDDKVVFGNNILPNDIWFKRSDNAADLYVTHQLVPILLIKNWFTGNAAYGGIDKYEFNDGTIWNRTDFYDLTLNLPQWGTSGNNTWVGDELANEYDGRGGNDNISGSGGDDRLFGGTGSDTVNGDAGLDYLYGGAGITTDTLNGGADSDIIMGGRGTDVLNGGPGADQLYGRNGPGIYDRHPRNFTAASEFDNWEGNATNLYVFGSYAMSTHRVGEDVGEYNLKTIFLSNFDFSAIPDSALITGFEINIHKHGSLMIDRTVRVKMADGTYGRNVAKNTNDSYVSYGDGGDLTGLYITPADLKDPDFGLELSLDVEGHQNRYLHYVDITVYTSDTSVTGRNYDNTGDEFTGGPGDDDCYGTGGNDTYYYNVSEGHDAIYEVNASTSGNDRLVLGENILPDDVSFSRTSDPLDLVINHLGSPIITIKGWYTNTSGDFGIDRIEFDGGTIWNRADFYDLTWNLPEVGSNGDDRWIAINDTNEYDGLAGNDYIFGGLGSDTLKGGEGNDKIHGHLGADILEGGPGDDYLSGRYAQGVYGSTAGHYQAMGDHDNIDISPWRGQDAEGNDVDFIAALDSYGGGLGSAIETKDFDSGVWDETETLRLKRFDFSQIPDSATITGIGIHVRKWDNPDSRDYVVRIRKPDGTYGTNVAKLATIGELHYGGHDDMMGLSLTPADVKNPEFTLELRLQISSYNFAFLYFAEVTIYTADSTTFTVSRDKDGNTYTGGTGNDVLIGTSANDIYHYASGDGDDALYESVRTTSGNDRLIFASGILPADVTFEAINSTADLTVKIGGAQPGSIRLKGWYNSLEGHRSIDRIEFSDIPGTIWDLATLQSKAANAPVTIEVQTPQLTPVHGTKNADYIVGSAGDDFLGGNQTDIYGINSQAANPGNTYSAGAGNDTVNGTTFGDTYLFNLGDGSDTIVEVFNTNGSTTYTDKLVFGSGLLVSNLSVTRTGNDLLLSFSTGESVTVQNWFISTGYHIEEIEFADSTVWTPTDVLTQLPGGTDTSLIWTDTSVSAATTGKRSSGSPVTGLVISN